MSYISGFKGSNGQIVVTKEKALLWTDGRYFLQAERELGAGWEMMKMQAGVPRYFEWLVANSPEGAIIGFDPYLISATALKNRKPTFENAKLRFEAVEPNLVNLIWTDRPPLSPSPIFVHPDSFTGATLAEKMNQMRSTFTAKSAKLLFTSLLDEVAWITNTRGRDIEYNPVYFSYLLVEMTDSGFTSRLFVSSEKVNNEVGEYFNRNGIRVEDYASVGDALAAIEGPVIVDPDELNSALYGRILNPVNEPQVITNLKGTKNEREVRGMRDCHVRDGRALCRYVAWLELQLNSGRTDLTEFTAASVLDNYRAEEADFQGLSFDTISAAGPNAAVIHYKPEEATAAPVRKELIYLVDSGGQYLDGTTDVTRTVHFGNPTPREKECYTRVLLGNLDLCRLKWPKGLAGEDMDVLARRWLWDVCLDYKHGTGHGVGYFLNVHEGPHGIGKHWSTVLQPGMVVTDEPGYYEDHQFGIRIEDLLIVTKVNEDYLTFENVTMCPYDRNLIDLSLLVKRDVEFIDAYHRKVWDTLSPLLQNDELTRSWLQRATAPLSA